MGYAWPHRRRGRRLPAGPRRMGRPRRTAPGDPRPGLDAGLLRRPLPVVQAPGRRVRHRHHHPSPRDPLRDAVQPGDVRQDRHAQVGRHRRPRTRRELRPFRVGDRRGHPYPGRHRGGGGQQPGLQPASEHGYRPGPRHPRLGSRAGVRHRLDLLLRHRGLLPGTAAGHVPAAHPHRVGDRSPGLSGSPAQSGGERRPGHTAGSGPGFSGHRQGGRPAGPRQATDPLAPAEVRIDPDPRRGTRPRYRRRPRDGDDRRAGSPRRGAFHHRRRATYPGRLRRGRARAALGVDRAGPARGPDGRRCRALRPRLLPGVGAETADPAYTYNARTPPEVG